MRTPKEIKEQYHWKFPLGCVENYEIKAVQDEAYNQALEDVRKELYTWFSHGDQPTIDRVINSFKRT